MVATLFSWLVFISNSVVVPSCSFFCHRCWPSDLFTPWHDVYDTTFCVRIHDHRKHKVLAGISSAIHALNIFSVTNRRSHQISCGHVCLLPQVGAFFFYFVAEIFVYFTGTRFSVCHSWFHNPERPVLKKLGEGDRQARVLSEEFLVEIFHCICEEPLLVNPVLPLIISGDIISVKEDFDMITHPPSFVSHTLFQTVLSPFFGLTCKQHRRSVFLHPF